MNKTQKTKKTDKTKTTINIKEGLKEFKKTTFFYLNELKNPYIKLHWVSCFRAIQNVMYALLLPLIVILIPVNLSYFRVKIDNEGLNYFAETGEVYAVSLKYLFTIFIFILLFELLKKYYENQFYMIFKTDSMISAREESILKSNSFKKDKRVFAKVMSIISSAFIFYFTYIDKIFDIGIIKKIFDVDSLKKHITRESMKSIINYSSLLFNAIVGISILYLVYKLIFPNFKNMITRSLELLEKNSYKEIVFKANSSDKNI